MPTHTLTFPTLNNMNFMTIWFDGKPSPIIKAIVITFIKLSF